MYSEVPKNWGIFFTIKGCTTGIKFIVDRILLGVSCNGVALNRWQGFMKG